MGGPRHEGPDQPRQAPERDSRSHRLWPGLFTVLVALQLLVLYAPSAPGRVEVTGLDKVVHASVFGLPALVATLRRWPWVLLALALHAPLSELVQHVLLPHRDGNVWDAVADLAGIVLGVAVAVVGRRLAR
ncbi:MAG TPA: VanZ family protein [Segeticoccus sp.]|jgi:VanZ family protein|nr:VanZ family protein [Segeticoccus sp.]